ncbi:MAG: hybrid sensor histidine kinase/response regulator, partial [Novosphingobium sp.]|nr:hybrid sensor histidine kinase/response regulator [Novosphingobium sp.]
RLAIVGIVGLALAWAVLVDPARSLASIGLVAFSAMVQFVPHLLLAVAGPGRNPFAAKASLLTGLGFWLYTLALPPILPASWIAALAGTPLDPLHLFGMGSGSPLVHGVLWSLTANLVVLALFIAGRTGAPRLPRLVMAERPVGNLGELASLTARFIGEERAVGAFPRERHGQQIDRAAARLAQELVAGVVGTSSARALVASALAGGRMSFGEVTRLLDEGGQSLSFSRQLLAATFENLQAGVSVIDAQLNLVAWNTRYVELFGYPVGLVRVGVPIAELIRYNIERGHFPGTVDEEVRKRLGHLSARRSYASERVRADGRVIKSVGGPMPGGGYLTSFTDITIEAGVRDELERTLDQLEQRVTERTRELSDANRRLADATREKTRFLAAASHDLLQPLHAARLFTSALDRSVDGNAKVLAGRVDRSIVAAEALLRALLDISKLDAGGIQPSPETVALAPLLTDLLESMRPLAEDKGLSLRCGPLSGMVETDPGLLRSVLQNLVANAVRYTMDGGVIVGVRRRGAFLRIDVVDSGVGIPQDRQREIFREFTRLGTVEAEGLGLGLAIVERIARLIGARIELSSCEGRGSRFSVSLPSVGTGTGFPENVSARPAGPPEAGARSLRVLVVDNEPNIVDATIALLEGMGHRATGTGSIAEAVSLSGDADVLLADFHLDGDDNGLVLIDRVRALNPAIAVALITAESGAALRNSLKRRGIALFVKPVNPADIEAFLTAASVREIKA